jgi:hypothetical protein
MSAVAELTSTQCAYAIGLNYERFRHWRTHVESYHGEPFPQPRKGQCGASAQAVLLFNVEAVRAWLAPRNGQRLAERGRATIDLAIFDARASEILETAERIRQKAFDIAAQAPAGEPIARDLTSSELAFALGRSFDSYTRLRRQHRDFPRAKRHDGAAGNALFYCPNQVREWLVSHGHDVTLYDLRVRSILARPAQQGQ